MISGMTGLGGATGGGGAAGSSFAFAGGINADTGAAGFTSATTDGAALAPARRPRSRAARIRFRSTISAVSPSRKLGGMRR